MRLLTRVNHLKRLFVLSLLNDQSQKQWNNISRRKNKTKECFSFAYHLSNSFIHLTSLPQIYTFMYLSTCLLIYGALSTLRKHGRFLGGGSAGSYPVACLVTSGLRIMFGRDSYLPNSLLFQSNKTQF